MFFSVPPISWLIVKVEWDGWEKEQGIFFKAERKEGVRILVEVKRKGGVRIGDVAVCVEREVVRLRREREAGGMVLEVRRHG